jgi:cytochrome c
MIVGPSLWGVIGRQAGTSPDANYSTALEEADVIWDSDTLDAFLAAPKEYIPGTDKVIAVPDQQQRSDLISYLQTLTD